MSWLTPDENKVRQRLARSRAGQIREGMRNYIATLAAIHTAWVEEDWKSLGYQSWAAYVDGEFGADRLQLPAEHRRKAVEELRLAGMSTRALADTLGVDRNTVKRDLVQVGAAHPPEEVRGTDGKTYRPARSPLVEAITGAIEDAQERAETYKQADENGPGYPCEGAEFGICDGEAHVPDCPSFQDHRDRPPGADGTPPSEAGADESSEASASAPNRRLTTGEADDATSAAGTTSGHAGPADPEPVLPPSGSGSPNLPASNREDESGSGVTSPISDPEQERTEEVCPTCGRPQ